MDSMQLQIENELLIQGYNPHLKSSADIDAIVVVDMQPHFLDQLISEYPNAAIGAMNRRISYYRTTSTNPLVLIETVMPFLWQKSVQTLSVEPGDIVLKKYHIDDPYAPPFFFRNIAEPKKKSLDYFIDFDEYFSAHKTKLEDVLDSMNARKVLLMGAFAEYCVLEIAELLQSSNYSVRMDEACLLYMKPSEERKQRVHSQIHSIGIEVL